MIRICSALLKHVEDEFRTVNLLCALLTFRQFLCYRQQRLETRTSTFFFKK